VGAPSRSGAAGVLVRGLVFSCLPHPPLAWTSVLFDLLSNCRRSVHPAHATCCVHGPRVRRFVRAVSRSGSASMNGARPRFLVRAASRSGAAGIIVPALLLSFLTYRRCEYVSRERERRLYPAPIAVADARCSEHEADAVYTEYMPPLCVNGARARRFVRAASRSGAALLLYFLTYQTWACPISSSKSSLGVMFCWSNSVTF
jgi:hypothetical protein